MSNLVPANQIEQIVGAQRHQSVHYGRAVSAEETVYILHSKRCRDSGIDLRYCEFSQALDTGIDMGDWGALQDETVALTVYEGKLIPGRAVR